MMKKVLVTGATGFIGNYVVEALLRKGHQVIASATNSRKTSVFGWYNEVQFIPFDLAGLNNIENIYDYLGAPDSMIHLAWEGLPNYTQPFHLEENLPRHIRFLEQMLQGGLKDITVTGTCLEYGMQEGCLHESLEAQPSNAYAQAKDALRRALEKLCTINDAQIKWARLFYMYGTGQNPKSLISQLDNALAQKEDIFNMSGGEQIRDFLPVEKAAEILVDIAMQNIITGIINCCSGKPVTVKDFVLQYLADKQKKIELNLGYYNYTDYEPMKFWGDIKKLNQIIQP